MAFKMKGSAFKLGNVATKSALKQASPIKDEKEITGEIFQASRATAHNKKHESGEWDKDHKAPTKMKSPLEQEVASGPTVPKRSSEQEVTTQRGKGKRPSEAQEDRKALKEGLKSDVSNVVKGVKKGVKGVVKGVKKVVSKIPKIKIPKRKFKTRTAKKRLH